MSKRNDNILSSPIEYLKGVGPQRAEMLKKELGIFTFKDLLEHFPYRHIDKTVVTPISSIGPETDWVQIAGKLISCDVMGDKRAKRLVAEVADATGTTRIGMVPGRQLDTKDAVYRSELPCLRKSKLLSTASHRYPIPNWSH